MLKLSKGEWTLFLTWFKIWLCTCNILNIRKTISVELFNNLLFLLLLLLSYLHLKI